VNNLQGQAPGLEGTTRAFSLLLSTGKRGEVRLFLRKSRVGIGCSVCTRSENALAVWSIALAVPLSGAVLVLKLIPQEGKLCGRVTAKGTRPGLLLANIPYVLTLERV
jgi:hypothetical protein